MHDSHLTRSIRREAFRLGFCAIGFSPLEPPGEALGRYEAMLEENRHGEMAWMEKRVEERKNPRKLYPEANTLISLAMSYNHRWNPPAGEARISRHAVISDYHLVMKERIAQLLDTIQALSNKPVQGFVAVDGAPILERSFAERSGCGRRGKNSMLIVPSAGSYVFLGELLVDIILRESRPPLPNLCGSCTRCIDSCPTGALMAPGKIDATKCISYLTVELKRDFTPEEAALIGLNLFGCDHCQECCPHNAHPSVLEDRAFAPKESLTHLKPEQILAMTRREFTALFSGTTMHRLGLKRLKRNAQAVLDNQRIAPDPIIRHFLKK